MEHFARIEADVAAMTDPDLTATCDSITGALTAARDATAWLGGVKTVEDALAGATPYLRLLAMLTAAHLMLGSAAAAAGTDREADQKRTTRFFCEQLLPTATALLPSITAGADALAGV